MTASISRASTASDIFSIPSRLKCIPLFINEPVYTKELENRTDTILKQYALGKLIVAGDNRFLSGDLLELLINLIDKRQRMNSRERTIFSAAISTHFAKNSYYAPRIAYAHNNECTLLRNPHIARNEEIQLAVYPQVEQMRKHYLGHLSDIVIVDTHMLAAERLGGADYDGDMIKTISDPIINAAVKRNYALDSLDNMNNIPLLKIPDALVLGPLKDKTLNLSDETLCKIKELNTSDTPDDIIVLLVQYYLANKPDDAEWVVLPTANFDMYFGNTNFSKKWLKKIPESIIIRDTFGFGVGRYKIVI